MFDKYSAQESAAFNEGFNACFSGESDMHNPYIGAEEDGELACHWLAGFEHCRKVNSEFIDDMQAATFLLPSVRDLLATPMPVIAGKIGVPLEKWPGNCYMIACQIQKHYFPEGRPVYGHYYGEVSPACELFYGRPLIPHGWVALPDGTLIDPTHWVFLAAAPAIRSVTGDEVQEYDEGGNRYRRMTRKAPPAWTAEDRQYAWPTDEVLVRDFRLLFGDKAHSTGLTQAQLFWLANLDIETLGASIQQAYDYLSAQGVVSFVPIDNRAYAQSLR